ncbi:palmitoyltransferase zdhhc20 [Anaeramoeba flamelloides]|uniref:Palmitoyltransferase n=1 Tax=Anaeramoeba flamelloides TaxID=1746091 RepID=A0AAV8AJU2_9EUKA|nr:palmitoyltransferase zdhhc20 [Anaeramoeba flamelloides]
MSEDQKGLTNIGNPKYIQNKSESNLPTSATSETIETRISENELNHNELYSEAKSQSALKSSLREKEDNLKTKINKVQSNLVYKCFVPLSYRETIEEVPPNLFDFPIGKEQHDVWGDGPRPPRSRYSETFHALILKADHICFLVGNFVAIKNYKFFILSLFYFVLNSVFTIVILIDYLFHVEEKELIFLSIFTGVLSVIFFLFLGKLLITHIYLISKNLTWLENLKKKNKIKDGDEFENIYNLGCWKNYKQALGRYWIFWFLPINVGMVSDGYSFPINNL